MKYAHEEWFAEAKRRFGEDPMRWKFICPVCKHVQSLQDYKDAGAPEDTVAFSCVGRWIEGSKDAFEDKGEGPCNYAGGGLFRLNPVTVIFPDGKESQAFDFAPVDEYATGERECPRCGLWGHLQATSGGDLCYSCRQETDV